MEAEAGDDAEILQVLEASFEGNLAGKTVGTELTRIFAAMSYRLERLERYTEYLLGMYYTFSQRRYAEEEIFRLQVELGELHEELTNALVMVPDLYHPMAAKVQPR